MSSLTLTDARIRADLLVVQHYEVRLDLTRGAETFRSQSEVRFSATTPGATALLDIQPAVLHEVRLNGRSLDVSGLRNGRFALPGLAEENVVLVDATMSYSRDGHGLHRAVDPVDDEAYVYGMAFLDAAPRIFGCFDQPDLKAPYDVSVRVPHGWSVFGNGATQEPDPGTELERDAHEVRLATTPPLATYFVTVCAGPWATVRDEHDGIPLSLSARASQREQLEAQAPQMLEITRQSFDYFHELFGERYPFGDYDQVFVPEFNAGAMENPGCVVHQDGMIFRGEASRSQLLNRSSTIAHEMAHMWFGDLVTMRWWDDLWLNESFAEYMSHRCLAEATAFTEAFVVFGVGRKTWGYGADRSPSTHPVAAAAAPDAQSALQNFDGISYAKGASVLRQLIAHIGDEAFVAGVRDHLSAHRFGNADLDDFLQAMERASGRDLGAWQQAWLRTSGADRVEVVLETEADVVRGAALRREAPTESHTGRPHTLDVAGYRDGVRVLHTETTVSADEQPLPGLVGRPVPALVVPNASDITWAEARLDAGTLRALPEQLAAVPDAAARTVVWASLYSGLARAEVDPRQVARTFRAAMPFEQSAPILDVVCQLLPQTLTAYLPEAEHAWAMAELAAVGLELLTADPDAGRATDPDAGRAPDPDAGRATGPDAGRVAERPGARRIETPHALTAARLVAATTDDTDLLNRWLRHDGLPGALASDTDLRWQIAKGLARQDALEETTLQQLADSDRTMAGHLQTVRLRTLRPTVEAKATAWDRLVRDESLSNHEQLALADAFWPSAPAAVVRDYRARYFSDIPRLADRVSGMALHRIAVSAFPASLIEADTLHAADQALDRHDLHPAVRRAIVDRSHDVRCALATRAAFPGGES